MKLLGNMNSIKKNKTAIDIPVNGLWTLLIFGAVKCQAIGEVAFSPVRNCATNNAAPISVELLGGAGHFSSKTTVSLTHKLISLRFCVFWIPSTLDIYIPLVGRVFPL